MNTLFQTIPKLSFVLTDSVLKALITIVKFWIFFVTHKLGITKRPMLFRFVYKHQPFSAILRHPMDVAVLREIYLDKEYDWCPVPNPKVIIDLGAHFGDTALYYHTCFPEAQIIAVEPAPESYERLIENTKHIKNIIPVQAAITDRDGSMTLNLMPSSLGNSLMARQEATTAVTVQAMTLKTLLQANNITHVDLLKFDIEGAEFIAFKDTEQLQKITAFIGEVHEDLGNDTMQTFSGFFGNRNITTEQLQNKKRFIVRIK